MEQCARRGARVSRGLIAAALAVCSPGGARAAAPIPTPGPVPDGRVGPLVRGSIVPLSYASGRYEALVQLLVEGSPLAGAQWDLRIALLTDGSVEQDHSASASSAEAWLPIVFEREIRFAPGPHVILLAVRERNLERAEVDARGELRLDIDWPDPAWAPAIVGPIAVMQPADALFVRATSSRREGPVQRDARVVEADLPTGMLSLVCRGSIAGQLHVESSVAGGTVKGHASLEPDLRRDVCAQIRDVIPAATLPAGRSRYEVRVTLVPKGAPVAVQAIEITTSRDSGGEAQRRTQIDRLLEQGEALLARGELAQAATTFSRALEIESHHGIRSLRDQAVEKLELQARVEQAKRETERRVVDGLGRARAFAGSGQLGAAIGEAQAVLELDPANVQAQAIRDTLVEQQARSGEEQQRQVEIAALRREIAALAAAKDHVGALAAANRVLSLDPDNTAAARSVADNYRALADNFSEAGNLAPIIDFFRLRDAPLASYRRDGERFVVLAAEDSAEGASGQAEIVVTPAFLLGGSVIDESDVELRFLAGEARLGEPTLHRKVVQGLHITEFVLHHRLGPALSFRRLIPCTLTAVVTDSEGAEVRKDHTVVYRVPAYRSLWLYSTAAAVLVLGGSAAQGVRLRRRRLSRGRRFNPYIVGAPVLRPDLFFGRERLIQRVLQAIPNNSVLLYGERRIGKTSLQHRLFRRLKELDDPDYAFFPVFIDLQGTPQELFFCTLMREILDELGSRLGDFSAHPALRDDAGYGYTEFARDVGRILGALAHGTDKQVKLVLQIDEIDELNGYDPRVNQRLRSLFTRSFSENVVAVVSGVAIRKDWASHGSPWYNFFEEIEVRAFEREDAEELVRRPIAGAFRLERGVVERIVEISACKPYRIQRLCTALVSRAHDGQRHRITVADVEAVRHLEES